MLNAEKEAVTFFICYKARLKYEIFRKLKNKLFMSYHIKIKNHPEFEVLILTTFRTVMILLCKKAKVVIDF